MKKELERILVVLAVAMVCFYMANQKRQNDILMERLMERQAPQITFIMNR